MLASVLLFSWCVLGVALSAPDDRVGIKLDRRHHDVTKDDGTIDEYRFFEMLNRAIGKYRNDVHISIDWSGKNKRATGKIPLTDYVEKDQEDELYYGAGTVGQSPRQTFSFDFDTGSSDLFVPGPGCSGCSGNTAYSEHGTNRHTMTSVQYGSGMVAGHDYFDQVCVASLCATKQNVISLTNAAGFGGLPSNSLLGMGFQQISNSGQPPFFANLVKQGVVSAPKFSFFLGREKSGTTNESELVLGATNPAKYTGNFTSIPVVQEGYWQVKFDGVTVGGRQAPLASGDAFLDTGTTIIFAPTKAAAAIFALIPGSVPLPGLGGEAILYSFPCNTSQIPQLQFVGKTFAINPLDFNLGSVTDMFVDILDAVMPYGKNPMSRKRPRPHGSGDRTSGNDIRCVAAIAGLDVKPGENLYVVGDSFLKNYYSVFDMGSAPSVSLAHAVGNYGA